MVDGEGGVAKGIGSLGGGLAEVEEGFADLGGAGGLGVHAFADGGKTGSESLDLVDDLGQEAADLPDVFDAAADFIGEFVHAHDAGGDGGVHFFDGFFDVIGSDGSLVGKAADFHGDDGEAEPIFAGFFGFDGGVEGEEVGLVGDLGDGGDDGVDVGGFFVQDGEFAGDGAGGVHDLAQGGFHAGEAGLAPASQGGGVLGDAADFVHGVVEFLGGGGDLFGGGADLGGGGGDFGGGGLLVFGGGGDLGGGDVDLDAGLLDLADEVGEVVGEVVEAVGEEAEFVAAGEVEAVGEVAVAHVFDGGGELVQRQGDGAGLGAEDEDGAHEDGGHAGAGDDGGVLAAVEGGLAVVGGLASEFFEVLVALPGDFGLGFGVVVAAGLGVDSEEVLDFGLKGVEGEAEVFAQAFEGGGELGFGGEFTGFEEAVEVFFQVAFSDFEALFVEAAAGSASRAWRASLISLK